MHTNAMGRLEFCCQKAGDAWNRSFRGTCRGSVALPTPHNCEAILPFAVVPNPRFVVLVAAALANSYTDVSERKGSCHL